MPDPPEPSSVYADDPAIADDAVLLRVVHPKWVEWEPEPRLKSEAFQDYPGARLVEVGVPAVAMSVALLDDVLSHGQPAEAALKRFGSDYGIASLTAGQVRACEQGILRWPTDQEPWHAMVFSLQGPKRSRRHRKLLAERAELIRLPARTA